MNKHSNLRRALLSTTGIALALGIPAAHAQDVLETVIVTAEKQAVDIQKTSLSITAIQPNEVAATGQARLQDILMNVAGVQVYKGAVNNGAYFIRGVGTTQGVSSTLEMIDGVNSNPYVAEALATADSARIEVLRGPQGTLYGRGALSGVVNIITNDPTDKYEGKIFVEGGSFNEVKSSATVNIPLSDDMALRVVAFSHQQTGYMHPDGRAGTDLQVIRGKFQYKPDETIRIGLYGDLTNSFQSGSADTIPTTVLAKNFASPAFGGFNPCGGDPHPNKYDPWHSPPKYYAAYSCTVPAQLPVNPNPVTGVCQIVSRQENAAWDLGFTADYDMGWATLSMLGKAGGLTFTTGSHAANPFLGTVPPQNLWSSTFVDIFEARLASAADDDFKWQTGLYYETAHNHVHNWNRISIGGTAAPLGQDRQQNQVSTDRSAYGQVTVPIADAFRLIGGLRYSKDTLSQNSPTINVKSHALLSVANAEFPTHKLTYKAGFEVDLSADSMAYGNIATGFRPTIPSQAASCVGKTSGHTYVPGDASNVVIAYPTGGCTTAGAGAATVGGTAGEGTVSTTLNQSVSPDSMTAYEVGVKNRFLNNKIQVNIDGYYYKFTSLYLSALSIDQTNKAASIATQQTGTKAYGSELEVQWLLTGNDRITLGLSYEHTSSGVSPFAAPQCFNYGNAAHPLIEVLTSTSNVAACSAKNLAANPATVNWVRYRAGVKTNDALFNAPIWNGNVGYQHIFDLESGASITAGVNVHFESSKQTSAAFYYDGFNAGYHTTNLSLMYNTADGKWQLAAWVRNIENHPIVLGGQSSGSGLDYVYPTMAPPRMWGVNLSAKF